MEEIVAKDTKGFVTHIRKVRAHVGVRGNELADAAAKSVITNKDPRHQSKVIFHTLMGAVPERPEFWLSKYKVDPPRPCGNVHGAIRIGLAASSWETLQPDALGPSQAFTRPSQQFRKHTRRAILASLRQTSAYRRRLKGA